MPRLITETTTLDDCEDEIIFTRGAVAADPDALDLLPLTDGWLGLVDGARAKDREARIAIGQSSAKRIVANGRLDDGCKSFGDDLHLDVKKDRTSARWKRFFLHTVGEFVKQRLAGQVAAVRAWLGVSGDPIVEKHRANLERWATAAQDALDETATSAQTRGTAHVAREELAHDLTRERDGLEALLVARAKERGLARDWPARFFRVSARAAATAADAPTDGAAAAPAHTPAAPPAA